MSTLTDFRLLVSSVVGLDNTAASAEQVLIDKWLNDGVVEVLRRTNCKVSIETTTLTSGTVNYELPTGVLSLHRVVDANNVILPRLSPEEILVLRRATSSGSGVYRYAVDGTNLLMVYPSPAAADVLTLYYIARPTVMSSGSHDPSSSTYGGIPTEYHRAIELYAMWKAADYADDEGSQHGDRYARDFVGEISLIRKDIRGKGGRKLSPARLASRTTIPSSPSQLV